MKNESKTPIQFFSAVFALGMIVSIGSAQDLDFPPAINLSGQAEGISTLNVRISATNAFVPRVDAYGIYNDFAQSLAPVDIELQVNKTVPVVSGAYNVEIPLFLGNNALNISAGGEVKTHFINCENKKPKQLEFYLTWSDSRFSLGLSYLWSGLNWLPVNEEHGRNFSRIVLADDAIRGAGYGIRVVNYGYARFPGHYHGSEYVSDCCGEELPPSGVSATFKILMDGEEVYSVSDILKTDYRYNNYSIYFEGEHHSGVFCLPWNIGCVALHAGDKTAAYTVNGKRIEPSPQGRHVGYFLNDGWLNSGSSPTSLEGSNGTEPIYLKVGESAQFNLSGTVNLNGTTAPAVFVHALDVVDVDNPTNSPPEGSHALDKAMITPTGVFIGLAAGHYQVGIQENRWWKPDYSFYSSADFPPIDVYVVGPKITPDYNRDGAIDAADKAREETGESFHFWVNDDDDFGDIAEDGSDVPGQGGLFSSANYEDSEVNGRCDLLDFFPVWLDLHDTLSLLPAGDGIEYKLRHDDEAVRFVYTDLTAGQANAFLTTEGNAYGSSFNQNAFEANSIKVTDSGVVLSTDFLDRIANDPGKGILMVEGIDASTKPLVLETWQDGSKLFENELNLSFSGVEEMYRWINLRSVAGGSEDRATDTNEPSNFPDSSSNGRNLVFVHGYNVSEQSARAWNAEMFKRLYQTGSNARFHGVTWHGNQTQFHIPILGNNVTPDYHVNVVNALNSALALKTHLNSLGGQTVVAGHSLGNMIVGAAVARWDADVEKWFMIDGAVAIEKFDGSESVQDSNMMHPDWLEYHDRLWASEWHELFGLGDYRGLMSWRNYFADALSKTYNFYSSGEDVLKTHVGDPGLLDVVFGGEAWCLQEKRKGRNWISSIGGSTYGGWGFNEAYDTTLYTGTNHVLLADEQISTNPFFRPGGSGLQDLYDPLTGSDFAGQYMYELLAGFVPARTLPCGANEVGVLVIGHNFNMNSMQNGWPQERLDELGDGDRWFHSDIKKVAYPYVHRVFDEFVAQGGLE